jgi:hypothetical protein
MTVNVKPDETILLFTGCVVQYRIPQENLCRLCYLFSNVRNFS